MAYTWSPALETGHPLIDAQHKELIKTINELFDECSRGKAKDQINKTVDFLVSYTKRHFSEEEALQKKSGYPDYPNHSKLHVALVQTLTALATELKQSGPTPTVINKLIRGVGDWLVNHIQQQDTKVAAHVQASKEK
jgi:hemerythrin